MATKLSKADFKSKIADAKEKAKQGFNDFELGQYNFKLKAYEMKNDNEQIIGKWVCTTEGDDKGKEFVKFFSVEKALSILLSEWRDLGYDTDQMDDSFEGLLKWCKMITKEAPEILATIYLKKGYPTMRIEERIEGTENAEEVNEQKTKAAPAATAPAAAKSVAKPSAKPTVEEPEEVVEEVAEVATEEVEEDAEVEVGSKIVFTWKGEDKEGEIKEIVDEKNFKVIADNGGKKGIFPVKVETITKVLPKK